MLLLPQKLQQNKIRIPKSAFITWLALHHKPLNKDGQHRVGLDVDTQCLFCLKEPESQVHLFFKCELIKDVSTHVCAQILHTQDWSANWGTGRTTCCSSQR